MWASRWLLICVLGLLCAASAPASGLAQGDDAWERRAEGEEGGKPAPGPVRAAIRGYESGLAANPDDVQARWKLLRALHFLGEFVLDDPEAKSRTFERGRELATQGLERLQKRVGSEVPLDELALSDLEPLLATGSVSSADVACLYFWSAIQIGAWSQAAGLVRLVTEGVASQLYRYAQLTQRLDPRCEEGGAMRLLGRLHASLPRVPLVTGWVDRTRSIPLLESALELAPEHPGNRLLLGMSLLDLAPERREEALALLDEVDRLEPRPTMRIEDLAIRAQARRRLAEVGQAEASAR